MTPVNTHPTRLLTHVLFLYTIHLVPKGLCLLFVNLVVNLPELFLNVVDFKQKDADILSRYQSV